MVCCLYLLLVLQLYSDLVTHHQVLELYKDARCRNHSDSRFSCSTIKQLRGQCNRRLIAILNPSNSLYKYFRNP